MLMHMLSISLASYQIAMSCGDRENFSSYLMPKLNSTPVDSAKKSVGFTVLGGLV